MKLKKPNEYYEEYEKLAGRYAKKLWDTYKVGMEYDDVLQEMKLKVYVAILSYIEKFNKFKKSGRVKPVPIEYYIRSSLASKVKDLIKEISNEKPTVSLSNDDFNLEIGIFDHSCKINWVDREVIVNDVDILHGLNWKEKGCFCLYLKGFSISALRNFYGNRLDPKGVIRNQIDYLKRHENDLLTSKSKFFMQVEIAEQ